MLKVIVECFLILLFLDPALSSGTEISPEVIKIASDRQDFLAIYDQVLVKSDLKLQKENLSLFKIKDQDRLFKIPIKVFSNLAGFDVSNEIKIYSFNKDSSSQYRFNKDVYVLFFDISPKSSQSNVGIILNNDLKICLELAKSFKYRVDVTGFAYVGDKRPDSSFKKESLKLKDTTKESVANQITTIKESKGRTILKTTELLDYSVFLYNSVFEHPDTGSEYNPIGLFPVFHSKNQKMFYDIPLLLDVSNSHQELYMYSVFKGSATFRAYSPDRTEQYLLILSSDKIENVPLGGNLDEHVSM